MPPSGCPVTVPVVRERRGENFPDGRPERRAGTGRRTLTREGMTPHGELSWSASFDGRDGTREPRQLLAGQTAAAAESDAPR
jgi:hypothetical protein